MHTLERFIAMLKDGRWHDTASLRKDFAVPETTLKAIIDFLKEYRFIEASKDNVRLSPSLLKFYSNLEDSST